MKKLMMVLAFAGLASVAANAQCDEFATPSTDKYSVATNSFWANWYIQVGVDANVVSRYGWGSLLKKDWHDGRTYGFDFAVGKWFTPVIGTRLKLNWENGAFYHAFRHGNDGVLAPGRVWETANPHKGGYAALMFDTQFNLSNMFCGYNESRVWNLIFFPRMGLIRNFGRNSYAPELGVGFESSWKISKRVNVYADVAYMWVTDDFVEYFSDTERAFRANNIATIDLGITYNIGKTGWSKAVSLDDYEALSAEACAKLAALRAQLKAEQDENARLRAELAKWANHKCPEATVGVAGATSVFFDLNSAKINSRKDLINLEAVASAAKNSGAKVVVRGSADSKTGSSAYNQKLSEARAQAVADELVSLGVDRAKIQISGVGGVAEVEPFNLNRRAIVTLK